jgi:hypothetical protein
MHTFSLFSADAFNTLLGLLGLGHGRSGDRVGRRVLVLWETRLNHDARRAMAARRRWFVDVGLVIAAYASSVLIFAVGSVTAATVGHKLFIEGEQFYTYGVLAPLLGFVVAAPTLFLAPLCLFAGQLYRARQDGLILLSPLASTYARQMHGKLLPAEDRVVVARARSVSVAESETLEGVEEMYSRVEEMRIVPFDLDTARSLVITAVGPMVPLLSTQVPGLGRIFELFKG